MRIFIKNPFAEKAFTLTEMMITSSLATMVFAGMIMAHMVGWRMFQYSKSKLGGTDDARSAMSRLVEDIRTSKSVKIGTGTVSVFVERPVNAAQQGNAIQIYPTTSTNNYIRYFLNSDSTLCRTTNGSSAKLVMANFITNQVVFTSENYQGVVLTNNENNRVIGLTMQFYQIQYPIIKIGSNEFYDFYQLRTKVTRRTLE
jgi:Tfp pilus assembly protein FimT